MSGMARSKFRLMSVLALVCLMLLLALGTWQVQRLVWKEDLLATIDTRIHSAPRLLETSLKTEPGTDYWPVTVAGTFRHESERHFFATWNGQSGYDVYTPFEIAPKAFVFVNRGFVPFDRKEAKTRAEGQIVGPVTIEGLTRSVLDKKPSWVVPENQPDKNIFYWKDIKSMQASANLPAGATVLPVFVDALKSATPPSGLPVGGVTIIDLPNNHLQYAITWYGLAAALAGVWIVMAVRQREPSAA